MKQVDLAEKLQISKSYLSEIESGNKTISVDLLDKYSQIFNVPASTFLIFKESVVKPMDKKQAARAARLLKFFEWVAHEDDYDYHEDEASKEKVGAT